MGQDRALGHFEEARALFVIVTRLCLPHYLQGGLTGHSSYIIVKEAPFRGGMRDQCIEIAQIAGLANRGFFLGCPRIYFFILACCRYLAGIAGCSLLFMFVIRSFRREGFNLVIEIWLRCHCSGSSVVVDG